MNTNLNTQRDPLPIIHLPTEVIMKITLSNEFTIQDAYDIKIVFTPKHSCFRDRELLGNEVLKVLTPEYKFAIYGHIDSVIRSGVWGLNSTAQKLDEFLEVKKSERLDTIDKSKII